jgi:hypothetical protein
MAFDPAGSIWLAAQEGVVRLVPPTDPGPATTLATTTTTGEGTLAHVSACPAPAPLPPELAGDERFVTLHASVLMLVEAVNRLPEAVRANTDFSLGWLDRHPVVDAAAQLRAGAASVSEAAAAILTDLGATGSVATGWAYPSDWQTVPGWVGHIEEMPLVSLGMGESLAELAAAETLEEAWRYLAVGGATATPCGRTATRVELLNAAVSDYLVEGEP